MLAGKLSSLINCFVSLCFSLFSGKRCCRSLQPDGRRSHSWDLQGAIMAMVTPFRHLGWRAYIYFRTFQDHHERRGWETRWTEQRSLQTSIRYCRTTGREWSIWRFPHASWLWMPCWYNREISCFWFSWNREILPDPDLIFPYLEKYWVRFLWNREINWISIFGNKLDIWNEIDCDLKILWY